MLGVLSLLVTGGMSSTSTWTTILPPPTTTVSPSLLSPSPEFPPELEDKVVALAKGRTVDLGYDSLSPIISDSPPPGVDFSSCTPDDTNTYCCVDFVGEIRSAVEHPVLECVTREETVCHKSYVTEYNPVKENQCDQVYEKKCHIEMLEIDINQTVTTCKRPLKRVCPNKVVDLVRRDTLQDHLKPLEEILTETLNSDSRDPQASSRSLDDNEIEVVDVADTYDDDVEDEEEILTETLNSDSR